MFLFIKVRNCKFKNGVRTDICYFNMKFNYTNFYINPLEKFKFYNLHSTWFSGVSFVPWFSRRLIPLNFGSIMFVSGSFPWCLGCFPSVSGWFFFFPDYGAVLLDFRAVWTDFRVLSKEICENLAWISVFWWYFWR